MPVQNERFYKSRNSTAANNKTKKGPNKTFMMKKEDVIDLLKKIENAGIDVWIDGGWGVDALLGRQTRPHNDIDIFIQKKDIKVFTDILISSGYSETKVIYTTDDHTCWCATDNRIVDLHLFEFVEEGTLRFDHALYPADTLNGKGIIGTMIVRCLTVEAQLLYHQGYEHTEKDIHDVGLLCDTFGLPIPEEYRK